MVVKDKILKALANELRLKLPDVPVVNIGPRRGALFGDVMPRRASLHDAARLDRAKRLIWAASDGRRGGWRKIKRAIRLHRQVYGADFSHCRIAMLIRSSQLERNRRIWQQQFMESLGRVAKQALTLDYASFVIAQGWVDPQRHEGDRYENPA